MRRLALVLPLFFACSSSPSASEPPKDAGGADRDRPAPAPIPVDESLLAARPYSLAVPKSYDASKPTALLLALHGYGPGDDGEALEKYFKLGTLAEQKGILYTHPDGMKDKNGDRFWNGTDACCDFTKVGTDDVAYLRTVVGDVARKYNLDRTRVYVVGLSAGGVMAHRLACDAADVVSAIVSVSGTTWADPGKCVPQGEVSVAEIHGTKDETVQYAGGVSEGAKYPSAADTVAQWARLNQCKGELATEGRLDLESGLAGEETRVDRYGTCARGAVELWSVEGGKHAPKLGPGFAGAVFDFLEAHPKR
jgi:polyhydroxybutyrate depolymerase